MDRRGFLGAILATGVAPAIVRIESLMPVRVPKLLTVQWFEKVTEEGFVSAGFGLAEAKAEGSALTYAQNLPGQASALWPGVKEFWGKAYEGSNVLVRVGQPLGESPLIVKGK
jgi:hypothetical protein